MDVPFLQLQFTFEQTRPATTPHQLFTLKQLFPVAFRKVNGCLHGIDRCSAGADCPCRATFGQALSADPSALRRYQKPPLPFAFKIPLLSCREKEEQRLSLVIAGDATRHLELYVRSIQHLFGSSSPFGIRLGEIAAVAQDGSKSVLCIGSAPPDLASIPFRSFAEAGGAPLGNSGEITLQLLTPLRLLHHGRPLRSPEFSALAGALFRRVSALAYYYGGVELEHDFKWLARQSREIDSSPQLEWTSFGGSLQGCLGELSFTGELGDYMPFLRLGELLNLGKGASYGMGSYRIGC